LHIANGLNTKLLEDVIFKKVKESEVSLSSSSSSSLGKLLSIIYTEKTSSSLSKQIAFKKDSKYEIAPNFGFKRFPY
jgi:hypothetical protein